MALIAARSRLAESGFAQALLWLLDGNVRAGRFYRRDGWIPDGTRRTAVVWASPYRNRATFASLSGSHGCGRHVRRRFPN